MLIYQFISPQVWASRPWRITTIKNNVSKLLVIFPFEQRLFLEKGINSKFVGHPLLNRLSRAASINTKHSFCNLAGLDPQKPIIALFPGSRKQEIAHILPEFLKAASILSTKENDMQFVISIANPLLGQSIESCMSKADASLIRGRNVFFVPSFKNHELMSHCDIAWAKCGTTTLEVGLFGKPMLICYRGSLLDYLLVGLLKTTRFVGLPNILAGQEIVPELLQNDCNPGLIARLTLQISNNPCVYEEMSKKLTELAGMLGSRDYVFECVKEIQESLMNCRKDNLNRDHVAH
jgi:lipid-A-disaccharide synthase